MSDIFDWNTDESVIIPEQPETAVYVNNYGQIVIRQKAGPMDEDDSVVILDAHNIDRVAGRMHGLKSQCQEAHRDRFKLEGRLPVDMPRQIAAPS